MKDLIITKADTSLVGVLRADMLSNAPANITILEMKDANGKIVDSLDMIGGFYKRVVYSFAEFLSFCFNNSLKVVVQDTNGANKTTLLINSAPAGTKYPIVSATGSTKTILIATDVSAQFAAGNKLVIYNSDNTIVGTYTEASDSYSAPNTAIVITETTMADIATGSGKYLIIKP